MKIKDWIEISEFELVNNGYVFNIDGEEQFRFVRDEDVIAEYAYEAADMERGDCPYMEECPYTYIEGEGDVDVINGWHEWVDCEVNERCTVFEHIFDEIYGDVDTHISEVGKLDLSSIMAPMFDEESTKSDFLNKVIDVIYESTSLDEYGYVESAFANR